MSITVELPPDLDQQVKDIPDVEKRVLSFLRDQVEYEKWRKARYSERARRLVEESKADAEELKNSDVPREEIFRRFFALHEEITSEF